MFTLLVSPMLVNASFLDTIKNNKKTKERKIINTLIKIKLKHNLNYLALINQKRKNKTEIRLKKFNILK